MDDDDKDDLWGRTREGIDLVGQFLGSDFSDGVDSGLRRRLEDVVDKCKALLGQIAEESDADWAARVQDRESLLDFAGNDVTSAMQKFAEEPPHDADSPSVGALKRGRDAAEAAKEERLDFGKLTAPWLETPELDGALGRLSDKIRRLEQRLSDAAGTCGYSWGTYLDGLKQSALGGGEDAEDAKRRIPDSVERGKKVRDILDYVTGRSGTQN